MSPQPVPPESPLAPTPESLAVLALLLPAAGATTTPHTESLYEAIDAARTIVAAVRARVAQVDDALHAADRAEADPRIFHWFERFKQNCDGIDRDAKAALTLLKTVTDTSYQMDRYALEWQAAMASHDDRAAATAARVVLLTVEEHAHLQARAALGEQAAADAARGNAPPVAAPIADGAAST